MNEIREKIYQSVGDRVIYPKMKIEPTNSCNLKCPLCPTNHVMTRERGMMSFEAFKKIISGLERKIRKINLWNFGEPFLNDNIFKMVSYSRKHKINVVLSTNSTLLNCANRNNILKSGISTLIVCLDGVTKHKHERYRVGSNFEETVANIRELINDRNKKSAQTKVVLQMLLTRDNQEDIEHLKPFSSEIGVDELRIKDISLGTWTSHKDKLADKWLPYDRTLTRYSEAGGVAIKRVSHICPWSRSNGVVLWDGSVTTCCYDYDGENTFSNALQEPYKDLLRSDLMSRIRIQIANRAFPLCSKCQETSFRLSIPDRNK